MLVLNVVGTVAGCRYTVERFEQPLNAYSLIDVTLAGMVMVVNAVLLHPKKARLWISTRLVAPERSMEVNPEHPGRYSFL